MAKSKAELMAEKMKAQEVGKAAFEAGRKPVVEVNSPATSTEPAQDATNAVEVTQDTPEANEPQKEAQEAEKTAKTASKASKRGKGTQKQKKPATGQKTANDTKEESPVRLIDTLPKRQRVEKKTNAYYLSVANIEKLQKAADDGGFRSASDLLDNILTAVFSE